jgi:DNA-3-methyladenine glycosylase
LTLSHAFYDRPVLEVARALLGCVVRHGDTAGVIVETEAYHHSEPASHAYVGLTARTSTLFGPPGRAYVYRSYGIHALLNAVTEPEGVGAAVLIRALEPLEGIEHMRARRGLERLEDLCSGPGKLTEALGVGLSLNGADLLAPPFELSERRDGWEGDEIVTSERIGITKAADLPWRYSVAGSRFVSRPWPSGVRLRTYSAATKTAAGSTATSGRPT